MATEQLPGPAPASPPVSQVQPLQAWLARLGLSGKLLAIGGLVGVIAVFLPLLTTSIQTQSSKGLDLPVVSASQSVAVIRDWRGILCLVGYIAALALAVVLYRPSGLDQKALGWAGVGAGAVLSLLALWLLILALNGSASLAGFGGSFRISVGIGAILNLLAAAAVAAGGVLKAREEKLI